jgi:hypothetical protein
MQLYERMTVDSTIAFEIRDKIVPNVLCWFTGEVRVVLQAFGSFDPLIF